MGDNKNLLLYPASLVYGIITGIRNFLFNRGLLSSVEFPIPIICVGNITVGGTGKTPHTEYIAGLLKNHFKVAILSRGYKRNTNDYRIASSSSLVSEIGDEPLQIYKKFNDLLVAVDKDRVHGVKKILEGEPGTEVIILDDGYQHRKIKPGFSILLSDYERLITRDNMMPFGSLRESKNNMNRADIILITKSPEDISALQRRLIVKEIDKAAYQKLYFTSIKYQPPVSLFKSKDGEEHEMIFSCPEDCGIVLVTGIANPSPFLKYLRKCFGEIIHLNFPDHYSYKEKDITSISEAFMGLKSSKKYLLTTEKDAVRLREFTNFTEPVKSAFFYIPVGIYFLNDNKEEFDNIIVNYVRKNKRNNRIS